MLAMHDIRLPGTPDLITYGLHRAKTRGPYWWFIKDENRRYVDDYPNEARVRETAGLCLDDNMPLIIDIEHWPNKPGISHDELETTLSKLTTLIDWARDECPGLRIGCYGILPYRDWRIVIEADKRRAWWDHHVRIKRSSSRFIDSVDFLMPSLYYVNRDWFRPHKLTWAQSMIREAKQFGKPVYPAINPRYHEGGADLLDLQIYEKSWRDLLLLCQQDADGFLIWTDKGSTTQPAWEDNIGWWRETQDVLKGAT